MTKDLGMQRKRRFGAHARYPRCSAVARRAASGLTLGPRRLTKPSRCGLHYVSVARDHRSLLRSHARTARCVRGALPERQRIVADAVRSSMKGNKGKDTKPEMLVRKRLRSEGLTGYRIHWHAPGKPDIAFPGKKVAIFVNGCFWHRCPHCNPSTPKTNQDYWIPKFKRNQERDQKNYELLRKDGWRVHVIWECELKKKRIEHTFLTLIPELKQELAGSSD